MMKIKRLFILLTCLVSMACLSACGNIITERNTDDRVEVYDKNEQKILEVTDDEALEYYTNLVEKSVEGNIEKDLTLVELPNDAKISYEYRFVTKPKDKSEQSVSFCIYENYPYMTLKFQKSSVITPITLELSEQDYDKLSHPLTVNANKS